MGLSRKLYELFRQQNQVEEFPQWVALGAFDKGAPPPFNAHQTAGCPEPDCTDDECDGEGHEYPYDPETGSYEEVRTRRLTASRDQLVKPHEAA